MISTLNQIPNIALSRASHMIWEPIEVIISDGSSD